MATRTISGRGNSDGGQRISNGPARLPILLVLPAAAAAAAVNAARGQHAKRRDPWVRLSTGRDGRPGCLTRT